MDAALAALPWLGALLAVALLLAGVCHWPLRFDVSGRALGRADGSWALAGGASLAFVSLTFAWARGARPQVGVLLFGRKLDWKPRLGRRPAKPKPKPKPPRRGKPLARRFLDRIDPIGLAWQLLSERRHLRLRYLVLDLAYGFRDPLLTGRLVGAISVLSVVLPAPIEVRQRPRWDFEDSWDIALDGRAVIKPWLVLLDLAVYVIKRLTSRASPAQAPLPAAGAKESSLAS